MPGKHVQNNYTLWLLQSSTILVRLWRSIKNATMLQCNKFAEMQNSKTKKKLRQSAMHLSVAFQSKRTWKKLCVLFGFCFVICKMSKIEGEKAERVLYVFFSVSKP